MNQSLNSNQLIKKYEKEIHQLKLELKLKDDMIKGRDTGTNSEQVPIPFGRMSTPKKKDLQRNGYPNEKYEMLDKLETITNKYETNKRLMNKYKGLLLKQRDIMIALSSRFETNHLFPYLILQDYLSEMNASPRRNRRFKYSSSSSNNSRIKCRMDTRNGEI